MRAATLLKRGPRGPYKKKAPAVQEAPPPAEAPVVQEAAPPPQVGWAGLEGSTPPRLD